MNTGEPIEQSPTAAQVDRVVSATQPYDLNVAIAAMRGTLRLWNRQNGLWTPDDARYLEVMRMVDLAVEEGWYARGRVSANVVDESTAINQSR